MTKCISPKLLDTCLSHSHLRGMCILISDRLWGTWAQIDIIQQHLQRMCSPVLAWIVLHLGMHLLQETAICLPLSADSIPITTSPAVTLSSIVALSMANHVQTINFITKQVKMQDKNCNCEAPQPKLLITVNQGHILWDSWAKPSGLLGGHLNIQSSIPKSEQLQYHINYLCYLCLSETSETLPC